MFCVAGAPVLPCPRAAIWFTTERISPLGTQWGGTCRFEDSKFEPTSDFPRRQGSPTTKRGEGKRGAARQWTTASHLPTPPPPQHTLNSGRVSYVEQVLTRTVKESDQPRSVPSALPCAARRHVCAKMRGCVTRCQLWYRGKWEHLAWGSCGVHLGRRRPVPPGVWPLAGAAARWLAATFCWDYCVSPGDRALLW